MGVYPTREHRPVWVGRISQSAVFRGPDSRLGSLDYYLREVRAQDRLSPDEEVRWGRKARQGDPEAVDRLVRANLPFVVSVAKQYRNRGVPFADLIQEGNAGLVIAARKFDPDQGVKFISYAVWWIRRMIWLALAEQGHSVRLPQNRFEDLARVRRERERLVRSLGRTPDVQELADASGVRPEVLPGLLQFEHQDVRLDAPTQDEGVRSLVESFLDEDAVFADREVEDKLACQAVQEALETLDERLRLVLKLYYGLDGEEERTLGEIARLLGVTLERVRQLRNQALKRLREGAYGSALASFV